MPSSLDLGFGLNFQDLYQRDGLVRLDQAFIASLKESDVELHNRLVTARLDPDALEHKAESELLVNVAPHVEDFLGQLFGISAEIKALQAIHHELAPIYTVKRLFVQRRAVKGVSEADAVAIDGPALAAALEARFGEALTEKSFATHVDRWMAAEAEHGEALADAQRYAAWATLSPEGKAKHKRDVLFKVPHKLDPSHLVPVETVTIDGVTMMRLPRDHWRHREGFGLTDQGMDLNAALD